MTQPRRAVAVDIGNTAVKVAYGDPNRGLVRWSLSLADPGWAVACVRRVIAEAGLPVRSTGRESDQEHHADLGHRSDRGPAVAPTRNAGTAIQWWVASVHRDAARRFRDAAGASGIDLDVLRIVTRADVPMPVDVDYPDRLGIDRLVGAWGAFTEFRSPLIVVDIGSAVTVDHVTDDGRFAGGAIMPGIALQIAGLASGTDALPAVTWERAGSAPLSETRSGSQADRVDPGTVVPGKNTEDAIRLGILAGIAGGIEKAVRTYREAMRGTETAARLQVVVTGGDAERIRPSLDVPHHHRPELVCRALLDLSDLGCPSPATVKVEESPPERLTDHPTSSIRCRTRHHSGCSQPNPGRISPTRTKSWVWRRGNPMRRRSRKLIGRPHNG